jgi:hypothetical protein
MLARTILVSPITDTRAATSTHFEESSPSHPVFTPIASVATAATMMTLIPIDAGTIDLRQNASAECGLTGAFDGRRRWSGMTIATFFPRECFMLHCAAGRKRRGRAPSPANSSDNPNRQKAFASPRNKV